MASKRDKQLQRKRAAKAERMRDGSKKGMSKYALKKRLQHRGYYAPTSPFSVDYRPKDGGS